MELGFEALCEMIIYIAAVHMHILTRTRRYTTNPSLYTLATSYTYTKLLTRNKIISIAHVGHRVPPISGNTSREAELRRMCGDYLK